MITLLHFCIKKSNICCIWTCLRRYFCETSFLMGYMYVLRYLNPYHVRFILWNVKIISCLFRFATLMRRRLLKYFTKEENGSCALHNAMVIDYWVIPGPRAPTVAVSAPTGLSFIAGHWVTFKFDGWPWKTIEHLFYATSSFVHHSIAICEFKVELRVRKQLNWVLTSVTLTFDLWVLGQHLPR